jgi:ABC-type nitrate/sulfonate/bicarbonate transport system permease component
MEYASGDQRVRKIAKLYPILLVCLLWEAVTRLGLVDPVFLPPLTDALRDMAANAPLFAQDAIITLSRAFGGLAIGAVAGLLIGVLMARNSAFDGFMDPLLSAVFPTPKLALFPLLMVWLGIGEASKIAVIAITAFFPVTINTYAGVRGVDRFLIWNAMTKGTSQLQLLTKVLLPAALPFIFAGLRVATSFSFLLVVAAEMLNANSGLGFRILYSERTFATETMYAAILLVVALGFVVDRLLGMLGKRLLAWQDTMAAR